MKTYGIDASLTHGVLVSAEWSTENGLVSLIDYNIIFQWQKNYKTVRNDASLQLGIKSKPQEITRVVNELVTSLPVPSTFVEIAIDWDSDSAYWAPGGKASTTRFAFMVGALTFALMNKGYVPVFVSPRTLRKHFQMKGNAPKESIVAKFLSVINLRKDIPTDKKNEDLRDALLLSYLLYALSEGEP